MAQGFSHFFFCLICYIPYQKKPASEYSQSIPLFLQSLTLFSIQYTDILIFHLLGLTSF